MKIRLLITVLSLSALLSGGTLFAQDAAGKPKRPEIPPESREKMKEAYKAAMEDPNVIALQKQKEYVEQQFRDALKAAMVKSDPSLKPILDQMPDGPMLGRGFGRPGGDRGDRPGGPGGRGEHGDKKKGEGDFGKHKDFPPEMKEKMEQVKQDPAVTAARAKLEAAKTPEEKKAAMEELKAARKAALERIAPDLAKRIEEFHNGKPGQ